MPRGHKDHNDSDGRTLLFSRVLMIVWDISVCHLPEEVIVINCAKVPQVWETVVVGVFLDNNAAGVFRETAPP